MKKPFVFRAAAAAAPLLALLAAACRPPPDGIRIRDAWVRLAALKGEPAAAYFRIEGGEEGTRLVGVSSPLARRVELHESVTTGGRAKMKPIKRVEFSYQGRIDFEAAGKHAMLFGLDKSVKEGGSVPITFAFDAAPPITVNAKVRSASAEGHESH